MIKYFPTLFIGRPINNVKHKIKKELALVRELVLIREKDKRNAQMANF